MDKKEYYPHIFSRSFLIFFIFMQTHSVLGKKNEYFFRKNDPKLCHLDLPKPMTSEKENLAKKLLDKKLYQEAIWFLQELKEQKNANYIKDFLYNLMTKEDFANYRRPLKELGGSTKPILYLMPCDVKVVFKEKSSHPSSNFRSEVASYLIDNFYHFNMVPMTVFKEVKGKKGSLQYFVDSTTSVLDITHYKKSTKLHIFDYILANKDRNSNNVLLLNGKEVAIDHGLSLRKHNPIGNNLAFYDKFQKAFHLKPDPVRSQITSPRKKPELFRGEEKILAKLRQTDYHTLENLLSKTLEQKSIKLLYYKISKLIRYTSEKKSARSE